MVLLPITEKFLLFGFLMTFAQRTTHDAVVCLLPLLAEIRLKCQLAVLFPLSSDVFAFVNGQSCAWLGLRRLNVLPEETEVGGWVSQNWIILGYSRTWARAVLIPAGIPAVLFTDSWYSKLKPEETSCKEMKKCRIIVSRELKVGCGYFLGSGWQNWYSVKRADRGLSAFRFTAGSNWNWSYERSFWKGNRMWVASFLCYYLEVSALMFRRNPLPRFETFGVIGRGVGSHSPTVILYWCRWRFWVGWLSLFP